MTDQPTFVLLGRNGDLCAFLPVLYAANESGQRSAVVVSRQYATVLEGASYCTVIPVDLVTDQLEVAYKHAKELSSNVKVVQTLGPAEELRNYVYKPAGSEHATTDSFVKEMFRLAGRLDLWKKQPPLIFDRRNEEREDKLVARLPKIKPSRDDRRKNIILVSANGSSSPFESKELLFALLNLKFGKTHHIVDLNDFKAERIYDLLGLYKRAACLVAIDSAHLHLAQACPQLPVAALVNDKPGLWYGSPWRPNYISHIRYSQFSDRAVSMLNAIAGIGRPGCWFSIYEKKTPKIIHVWNQNELDDTNKERHLDAESSWKFEFMDTKQWISCPVEKGNCGRTSKTAIKDDKPIAFLKDVIRIGTLRASDEDYICFTKADTCFQRFTKTTPGHFTFDDKFESKLTGTLLQAKTAYSHRWILDGDKLTYHPAVDLFCFSKKWWQEHQAELPDVILGKDSWWWRALVTLLKKYGGVELTGMIHTAPAQPVTVKEGYTPPRLIHNEHNGKIFLESNSKFSHVPKVEDQLPAIAVNPRALKPFGYNASIIRWNNRTLLAYRWHEDGKVSTKLAMADLDQNFNVTNNRDITIVGGSSEDPRCFIYKGELWMSWVESTWPNKAPVSIVKFGKLIEGPKWTVGNVQQLAYGKNDGSGIEKNWQYFEAAGKLFCIYRCFPTQIIVELNNTAIAAIHESPAVTWPWGFAKGGTVPIPYKGKLLRFFHSTLDNEPPPWRRRYYLGTCIMEPEPPFKVIKVGKKPIARGSEQDNLTDIERSTCGHRKVQVIFPGGIMEHDGGFLISCGVNDCSSLLLKIKETDLHL